MQIYADANIPSKFSRFEVVAHYLGLNREYSPVAGKKIHWPGGREGPPADVPECGFLGNDPSCTSRTEAYTFVAYTSLALVVFLLVAVTAICVLYRLVIFSFYRHYRVTRYYILYIILYDFV